MRQSYLALICGLILVVILGMSWCGKNSAPEPTRLVTPTPIATLTPVPTPTANPTATAVVSAAPSVTPPPATPTPAPAQTPSPELRNAASKVQPAVVLVTVFDAAGRLLRNGTGFFVSNDGRLVTDARLVNDAGYAVAKSPDGKIRNVSGIVATSSDASLAILKAETKTGVPYLALSKNSEPKDLVAIVGSSVARRDQPIAAVTLSTPQKDLFEPSASLSADAIGAPVVDANADVIGIVAMTNDTNGAPRYVVRPAATIDSLFVQTKPNSKTHWAIAGMETPTPTPTPAKKLRIIANPSPIYPDRARYANPPASGSGRFRIMFGADGLVKEVQIVQSTKQPILDQAAVTAFRQWKSEPGHEWSVLIPITFKP
jgi:TonB family protein